MNREPIFASGATRSEEAISEEALHREPLFATPEVLNLVLDRAGRIVRFNPAFGRLAGWSLAEVVGRDWFQLCIPGPQQRRVRKRFLGSLEPTLAEDPTGGEPPGRCEMIQAIVTQRGELQEVRWSLTPLRDANGQRHAVLAVGTELTGLLRAQSRVLQAERLAAIGQTITGLAHESRNALQRIQAGLEMLGLELGKTPAQHRDLGLIQRATDDLHDLLEEVRSFAAPIHLQREQVALPRIWRRVWQQLQQRHPEQEMQFREVVEVDQYRVPGEGRVRLIRRVAVCARGRSQRAELPQRLVRRREEVDELPGPVAEVADAVRARE